MPTLNLQQGATTVEDETDDINLATPAAKPATPAETQLVVEEVMGQVSVTGPAGESSEAGEHEEVTYDGGTEAEEEVAEASPEQLAATVPESENIASDLRDIEGFEEGGSGESAGTETMGLLPEAGTSTANQPEFWGFLAPLITSVVPTLISKIGPKVAKKVVPKLSQRALSLLKVRKNIAGPIGTISKLLFEAAAMETSGTESGEEVDPGLVESMVSTMETIIGTDDRLRIRPTTRVPWRRICALRIQMRSGAIYRGTGFFIGPRALATAGHCVYMHNQGGWARQIQVIPGCDGSQHPFGEVIATTFRSTKGWIENKKPESDYACILLPENAFPGQNIGYFGFGVFQAAELLALPAIVAGYPGDKPFAELWGMLSKIKAVTPLQLVYDMDTMGGQSGCPVFVKKGGKRYVVGIHNYGAATGNSATRVTREVYKNLQQWSKVGIAAAKIPLQIPIKTRSAAA